LTDSSHIHELGPGVDHGTILSHPESLAAIKAVLTQIAGSNQPVGSGEDSEEDEQSDSDDDGRDERSGRARDAKSSNRGLAFSAGGLLSLPGVDPFSLKVKG
jgi:hypothetical protein